MKNQIVWDKDHPWWAVFEEELKEYKILISYKMSFKEKQEELAKKCGVSRQTVNAIENDKYDPTLALAFNLARELKTTVDELFKP